MVQRFVDEEPPDDGMAHLYVKKLPKKTRMLRWLSLQILSPIGNTKTHRDGVYIDADYFPGADGLWRLSPKTP